MYVFICTRCVRNKDNNNNNNAVTLLHTLGQSIRVCLHKFE